MPGKKTIKRLHEVAENAKTDRIEAAVLLDAAVKIERLIAALNAAKIAVMSSTPRLSAAAEKDINDALKSLDEGL